MYLTFEPRFGCFSSLGRIGDRQLISLQKFGCVQHGIVQHEVLHALGFYHEHTPQRPRPAHPHPLGQHQRLVEAAHLGPCGLVDYMSNFKKMDTNNLGTPYDYQSVMHYGRTAFSSEYGKFSMTPIPDTSAPIGQRVRLSPIDVERVNKLYQCGAAGQ
ncbi:hypothetical protein CRUP_018971 [Coryphaenoides rupestris]|nr:hypothetical protein CRUP_018971 [Coryphaenoides rupestris]